MDFNLGLTLLYALWGLVVGLMVGFTAIGTGLLGSPGLMLFFGLDSVMAVGTMGLAGVFMMTSGVIQHCRKKNIEWRIAILFSVTALPASYITARYADAINEVIPLKIIIGIIILLSTGLMFYRFIIMKPKPRVLEVPRWKLIAAPFIGIVMGTLIGATSISGSIILIMFLLVLKLPSPMAVGTTSTVAAISLAIAAVAHVSQAHVDWMGVIGLTPGVIIGAAIGSHYVSRVPRNLLRYAILLILVAAGIMVFLK